jgi:hypothetical protein
MPILFALTAVIQGFFLFHVFRTGRPHFWALLILFAPGIGCVIYYLAVIFPGSREHRNARRVASHLAEAVMPNSELQRRLMEVAAKQGAALAVSDDLLRQNGAGPALREFGILTGPTETRIRGRSRALSVWFWRNDSSGEDESALMR